MADKSAVKDGVTDGTPSGSAPETKPTGTTDSTVGTNQETESKPEDGVSKGLKKELYNLRSKNREYKSELETLRTRLEAVEKNGLSQGGGGREEPAPSLLEDPGAFMHKFGEELLTKAEHRAVNRLKAEQAEERQKTSLAESERWLLSQNELKEDPEAKEEIFDVIQNDPQLMATLSVAPQIAVKTALQIWRESKGIDSTTRESAETSQARARTAKPSPSGSSSAAKVWSQAEIKAYTDTLDTRDPKFNEKWEVVRKAIKEGRVK